MGERAYEKRRPLGEGRTDRHTKRLANIELPLAVDRAVHAISPGLIAGLEEHLCAGGASALTMRVDVIDDARAVLRPYRSRRARVCPAVTTRGHRNVLIIICANGHQLR